MGKHCCHGVCNSDSRYEENIVVFIPFPKPSVDGKKAERWVYLCGRENFTLDSIQKWTYICSKHFSDGELLDWRKNPSLEPYSARKPPRRFPVILKIRASRLQFPLRRQFSLRKRRYPLRRRFLLWRVSQILRGQRRRILEDLASGFIIIIWRRRVDRNWVRALIKVSQMQ